MNLRCEICENQNLIFQFSEQKDDKTYNSYYCETCDLYQTRGNFDAVSPDYIDLELNDLTSEHVFKQRAHKHNAFRQLLNKLNFNLEHKTLLDFGCGVGGFLDYVEEKYPTVQRFGFDASESQIKVAQNRHANCLVSLYPSEYSSSINRSDFEIVTMWDVFEHIREPHLQLTDIKKVMKKNGHLIISVPCGGPNKFKLLYKKLTNRPPGLIPWEHVFYYTKNSLRQVMLNAGFEVKDVGYVYPYRRNLSFFELVRRSIHHLLGPSKYALQIYIIAEKKDD